MGVNYPAPPVVGQTYSYTGKRWTFNGRSWVRAIGPAEAGAADFPDSPAADDMYYFAGRNWKWSGSAWLADPNEVPASQPAVDPPASPPAPAPTTDWGSDAITLLTPVDPNPDILQVGPAWIDDGVEVHATRGTYTGSSGPEFESAYGRSLTVGSGGEIAFRSAWKWPTSPSGIKATHAAITGNKPGYKSYRNTPHGSFVLLEDDAYSLTAPSGSTPSTFFPMFAEAFVNPFYSVQKWSHLVTPSGEGQLVINIWIQSRAEQTTLATVPPVIALIQIPLDWWGTAGTVGQRNPSWFWGLGDNGYDGLPYNVYSRRNYNGLGWTFISWESADPMSLDPLPFDGAVGVTQPLSNVVNFCMASDALDGRPFIPSNVYVSSVEIGVQPFHGVGDVKVYDHVVIQDTPT